MAESASASIDITQLNPTTYKYSINVADTGTTPVGTFWFSWVPGQGYLHDATNFTSPAGWTATLTDGPLPTNGFSILWTATTAGSALQPGQQFIGFSFTSTMTPEQLFGTSTIHPPTPVTTTTIYSGGIFSDAGFTLTADPGTFEGTIGNDTLIGTSLPDTFDISLGGADVVKGGGGDDVVDAGAAFDAGDKVDGGAGNGNELHLAGNYSAGLKLHSATLRHINSIVMGSDFDYSITSNDGNVRAGDTLTVNGQSLGAADMLNFNGGAETDGSFMLLGSAAADVLRGGGMSDVITGWNGDDKLIGGAGADLLTSGQGADFLYGGAGNDRFVYNTVADSMGAEIDWIRDWNTGDRIALTSIDANPFTFGNDAFSFIGAAAFSGVGQIQARASGSNTIIRGDVDGNGTADLTIKLVGNPVMTANSFIL